MFVFADQIPSRLDGLGEYRSIVIVLDTLIRTFIHCAVRTGEIQWWSKEDNTHLKIVFVLKSGQLFI